MHKNICVCTFFSDDVTLKSFFLAKRGLAEMTISGGLLLPLLVQLRQLLLRLAAGEVEEEEVRAAGEAEGLAALEQVEVLAAGEVEEDVEEREDRLKIYFELNY